MSRLLALAGLSCLLWISLPLAIMATFTTALAFSALLLRVSILYMELLVALISSWISVIPSPPLTSRTPRRISPSASMAGIQTRAHRAPPKSGATASHKTPRKTGSLTSLIGASGSTRDFEGVGGWRLTDNGEDDAIWMAMNSRLELPARRHHHRSLSSQSMRFGARSPDTMRSSPMDGRARTPKVDGTASPESYFTLRPQERLPVSPEETVVKRKRDERRLNVDSSTGTGVI